MSNVVEFISDQKRRRAVAPSDETGRIVLFTGVRYVRDEVDAAPEAGLPDGEADAATIATAATERLQA